MKESDDSELHTVLLIFLPQYEIDGSVPTERDLRSSNGKMRMVLRMPMYNFEIAETDSNTQK